MMGLQYYGRPHIFENDFSKHKDHALRKRGEKIVITVHREIGWDACSARPYFKSDCLGS